jgi:hypothetical protein
VSGSVLDQLRAQGLLAPAGAEIRQIRSSYASAPASQAPTSTLTAALLEDFARHGSITEVRVPGIPETLFMVPTLDDARRLMVLENISRGRIWTPHELLDMAAIPARTPQTWAALAVAKIMFDGDFVAVLPRLDHRA